MGRSKGIEMKARYSLAAVVVSVFAAFPASASVLSASGQAVGTRPTNRADYLRVTQVQDELNATTKGLVDEAVVSGALSTPAPVGDSDGAYILQKEGNGNGEIDPDFGRLVGAPSGGRDTDRLSLHSQEGQRRQGGSIGSFGAGGSNGNNGGHRGDRGRHGGAQPSPEPSTWMLLGGGLAVLGGYAMLHRRRLPG
jgi:hypothetical protein